MPVSKNKHKKKNNSFGIRKEQRRKKEAREREYNRYKEKTNDNSEFDKIYLDTLGLMSLQRHFLRKMRGKLK
jgi:hypothetical protein